LPAHVVSVTRSIEQGVVGRRWCYVPFVLDVNDECSKGMCERCGKMPRTGWGVEYTQIWTSRRLDV
jgi:hypothetical protein